MKSRKARIPRERQKRELHRGRQCSKWGRGQETNFFLCNFTGSSQKGQQPLRGGSSLWYQDTCLGVSEILVPRYLSVTEILAPTYLPHCFRNLRQLWEGKSPFITSFLMKKCLCILLDCTRSDSILLLYCIVLYLESFLETLQIEKLVLLLACFKNVNELILIILGIEPPGIQM